MTPHLAAFPGKPVFLITACGTCCHGHFHPAVSGLQLVAAAGLVDVHYTHSLNVPQQPHHNHNRFTAPFLGPPG